MEKNLGYVKKNILPSRRVAQVEQRRVRRTSSRGEHHQVKCGRCENYSHDRHNCNEPQAIV